jgi:hypothetical protein
MTKLCGIRGTKKKIETLKIKDLMSGDGFVTKYEFVRGLNSGLSQILWGKLDKIRRAAKIRYGADPVKKSRDAKSFFRDWKKGSKLVRKILDEVFTNYIAHNMVKFAENAEIVVDWELAKRLNLLWTKSYFGNDTRVFIFKMHNNTLALNTVLSHFVRNISRNCTFCDLTLNPEEEDETPLHFFYNCTVSENIRNSVFKTVTNNRNFMVSRREFFGEFKYPNNLFNEALQLVSILLKKFLWDCRVRKNIPVHDRALSLICDEIRTMRRLSTRIDSTIMGSNLQLEYDP